MTTATELHRSAMDKAELAVIAKLKGDLQKCQALSREALDLESQAAATFRDALNEEPTRSILYRSAASLALDCGEYRAAEQLITAALSGFPSDEIAEELRDLLDRAQFSRHLDVRGVTLSEDEFQMSMTGNLVGPGIADSEEFVTRVKATETLVYRTAERQLNRKFRERGRRRESLKEEVELFISVPRAASFAVSFKVGHPKQMKLPTMNFGASLVDEVLACLDLVAHDQKQKLRERIPEEAYFQNFIGLANEIGPDGEAVKMVGFTTQRGKSERRVVLTSPEGIASIPTHSGNSKDKPIPERGEFRGRLKYADERRQESQRVQLIGSDGKSTTIYVPEGMMSDVVSPYWGADVTIVARREKQRFVLEKIRGRKRPGRSRKS